MFALDAADIIQEVTNNIQSGKYIPLRREKSRAIREYYRNNLPDYLSPEGQQINLYSSGGLLIASGYERIVIGDYGAYIEVSPEQIIKDSLRIQSGQEYRINDERFKDRVKYVWLTAKDDSGIKIYFQRRRVAYADYLPGMYYISPDEISSGQEEKK